LLAFTCSLSIIFNAVVNKRENVTAIFSALADPTRREIMERLYLRGETRATALAVPFRISMPAISRHLRVLEDARLIERRRKGRLHLIRARRAGLEDARRWMTHYAAAWDSALDALDDLIRKDRAMGEKR
jgi:DNA-binding transcriptional ArsR family regulator